jgi:hypothetical protein
MPITAIALSNFWDMACSLSLAPLPSILSLVGQEHGRTIPLTEIRPASAEFGNVLELPICSHASEGSACFDP